MNLDLYWRHTAMLNSQRWITGIVALALCGGAFAAAPSYYARKGTWQETMQASREALVAHEQMLAKKAELGGAKEPAPAAAQKLSFGPFHTIGPFAKAGKDAFDHAFEPELEVSLTKSYGRLRWQRVRGQDSQVHGLTCPDNAAIYFYRTILAPRSMKLPTYYGSDDGLAVWCNGKKVISNKVPRGVAANQDRATLSLTAGENHLLIKIWNRGGSCGWYFSTTGKERGGSKKLDPAAVRREQLWDLVRRDFPAAEPRQQMDWEAEDNIWSGDWTAGDVAALAKRYVGPSTGTQAGADVKKLAAGVSSADGLAKVRRLYYRAKTVQQTLAKLKDMNFRAVRMAVEDMTRSFGKDYPKGPEYLRRLDAMEKAIVEAGSGGGDKQIDVARKFLALRADALLANPLLKFDKLMLVKRGMKRLGLPQNWQGNCALPRNGYDDAIVTLEMSDLGGKLETLYRPERDAFVGDVDLHFDGTKMLFSSLDENNRWQVYEIGADGKGRTLVTEGSGKDVDNYDAVYLPDGRIIFGSTRCFTGVPCVGGGNTVANLYLMNADRDPKTVRQITFEQDHDWCPAVMPDGRVMYTRWEYSDAPHYFTRVLFSMNPDGTGQMELYGSNSYWPNSLFYARSCPGHPTRFVGVISGHHGVPRMGELILFDPAKGRHEVSGVVQRIPGHGKPVEPRIADGLVDGSWPRFLHPWPLSDKYFLVSCQKTNRDTWDLYLVDVFDNMLLLHKEAGYAMFEPMPLAAQPKPPAIPDRVDLTRKDAVVYMADVYAGDGLKGVPRGAVKKLRVYSFHYAYYRMGGHINIGIDGPWDVHRILGTVPVQPDGSAMFRVPANTPLAVQPLDEDGKALQVMRSWMTAMPGEFLSCVGCHERQSDTAPLRRHAAAIRPADNITPWYGPARGFGFTREVQPVLDRYCVGCHDGTKKAKSGQAIPDFRRTDKKGDRGFSPAYHALHPFVRRPGPESDYHLLPALEYHADGSELVQMLRKGHGGVRLDEEAWDRLITWIDLNVPGHGTWSEHRKISGDIHSRRLEMAKLYAGIAEDPEKVVAGPTGPIEPVKPAPAATKPGPALTMPGWPFDASEAKQRQQAAGAKTEMSVEIGEGLKLDMVLIPAGEFVMGDVNGWADEWPQARVKIDRPFWMGKLEITNEQYARFDSTHDSRYISIYNKDQSNRGEAANRPNQPVIRASWQQAMAFCRWLSAKTGREFTLPTEAQWEYACRAGTATPMNYGTVDTDFGKLANFADQRVSNLTRRDSPKWIPSVKTVNDGSIVTDNGGKYTANAWGLHDMHGNVAEWTRSAYRPYPYSPADGRDAAAAGRKVVRGGSFYDRPKRGTSSFRLDYPSWRGVYNVGFRVICDPEAEEAKAVVAAANKTK
jgi:formylglycine-generating enzyme required for sulfatase activity